MPDLVNKQECTMFILLITGYFKVLYFSGQNHSGFKVIKIKSASLKVYSRPLCKINSGYNTWALLSRKFYPFFFSSFCFAFFSFI